MTAQQLDVSVIICTYTEARWDVLEQAVQSLQRQSIPPREVLVVVDHNPALLERARRDLRGATAIENCEPRGANGSRNSGIAVAQGSIIAFLDDDAVAAPDWIERHVAAYTDDSILGIGGAIEPRWQNGRPRWFPEEFYWVVGCTYRGLPRAAAPVRNLISCNMSVRRSVFDTIGGFRPEIGHIGGQPFGNDETEFCIRLRQRWADADLYYHPQVRVQHHVPASRARWSYFRTRCYLEGRSKARLAQFVGAAQGSSSERAYVLRTLPGGIARGLADALVRRDPSGLARAGAIVAGLAITTSGYLRGILSQSLRGRPVVAPAPPIAGHPSGLGHTGGEVLL